MQSLCEMVRGPWCPRPAVVFSHNPAALAETDTRVHTQFCLGLPGGQSREGAHFDTQLRPRTRHQLDGELVTAAISAGSLF